MGNKEDEFKYVEIEISYKKNILTISVMMKD